tara:strand:- start:245 stop:436 length:192 start_codon:yes stop_codon:yes gene_type:complete
MIRYRYKKTIGMIILLLMVYSYVSFFDQWNTFLYNDFIYFLRWINLPESGWLFLDKYIYNGAL